MVGEMIQHKLKHISVNSFILDILFLHCMVHFYNIIVNQCLIHAYIMQTHL